MTPMQRLQDLYANARRALCSADDHDKLLAHAQAIAAVLEKVEAAEKAEKAKPGAEAAP